MGRRRPGYVITFFEPAFHPRYASGAGKNLRRSNSTISWDRFDIAVSVPSLGEQRAIADYLDTETARIDALITKKRRLITLLEERMVWLRCRATVGQPRLVRASEARVPPDRWTMGRRSGESDRADMRARGRSSTPTHGVAKVSAELVHFPSDYSSRSLSSRRPHHREVWWTATITRGRVVAVDG